MIDAGLAILNQLKGIDQSGNDAQHRDTIKTLFTIVSNLIQKPFDEQVRRFNKSNKAISAKIMAFPHAIRFLKLVRPNLS